MAHIEYHLLLILAWCLLCTFAQPTSTYFYVTTTQIRRYDSATNVDVPLYTRSNPSLANVVFNPTLNRIAYRESVGILSMYIDGSGVQLIVNNARIGDMDLTYDWINSFLYYHDGSSYIHRCSFDGTNDIQYFNLGWNGYMGMAVDPQRGWLYYSWANGGIYRLNLTNPSAGTLFINSISAHTVSVHFPTGNIFSTRYGHVYKYDITNSYSQSIYVNYGEDGVSVDNDGIVYCTAYSSSSAWIVYTNLTVVKFNSGTPWGGGVGVITNAFTTGFITSSPATSGQITTSPITSSPLTTSPLTTSPLTTSPLTTSRITSGLITTSPITSGQITTSPLTSGLITTSPLTSASLSTSPLTTSPLTSGQITTSPLTTAPVTTSPLTTAPVTSSPLTTSPVTSSRLTTAPVTTSPLTTFVVTSSPLTTTPITTTPLTTSPVTTSKLTTSPITTSHLTSSPLTTDSVSPATSGAPPLTSGQEITSSVQTSGQQISTQVFTSGESNLKNESSLITNNSSILGIIIGVSLLAVALIGATVVLCIIVRRRRQVAKENKDVELLPSQAIPVEPVAIRVPQTLSNIRVKKLLETSKEGVQIFLGDWNGTPVILKKVLNDEALELLNKEMDMLTKIQHPNCVLFLGTYRDTENFYIVTEYISRTLKDLLNKKVPLTTLELIHVSSGIARGLAYLEDRGVAHRDVALRNILVTKMEDKYSAKVSEFGMSRSGQTGIYTTAESHVPIKWRAIELLRGEAHTIKSDVWSFGVLLYEIFSYGKEPYDWLSNREAYIQILKGEKLPKPEKCPDTIYRLMQRCWEANPADRPTFNQIIKELRIAKKTIKRTMKSRSAMHEDYYDVSPVDATTSTTSLGTDTQTTSENTTSLSSRDYSQSPGVTVDQT